HALADLRERRRRDPARREVALDVGVADGGHASGPEPVGHGEHDVAPGVPALERAVAVGEAALGVRPRQEAAVGRVEQAHGDHRLAHVLTVRADVLDWGGADEAGDPAQALEARPAPLDGQADEVVPGLAAERRERRQGRVPGDDHRRAGNPVTQGTGRSLTLPVATAAPGPRVAAAFTHPARFNRPRLLVSAKLATGGVAGSLARRARRPRLRVSAAARDPSPAPPAPPPRGRADDDGAASHLAAPERLEALVDLVERIGAADELVELQATVEVELHQAREVEGGPDRAVHRPLERLLVERHRI